MSSSSQQNNLRFWCHQCRKRISPLQDFTCPTCKGAFIEEIENDTELFQMYTEPQQNQQQNQQPRTNPNVNQYFSFSFNQNFTNHPHGDFFQVFMDANPQRNQQLPFGNLNLLMQHFFEGFEGDLFMRGPTQGIRLGDYILGGNLDQIIAQMMEQFDGPKGKPPASKKAIDKLPVEEVTQKEVDTKLACPVCLTEFQLKEKVLKMPCEHKFHKDCLIPWLTRRCSCPVCRHELETDDKDYERQKQQQSSNSNGQSSSQQNNVNSTNNQGNNQQQNSTQNSTQNSQGNNQNGSNQRTGFFSYFF